MYNVTQRFREAVINSHTIVSKVEVYDRNMNLLATVPVREGSVTIDGSSTNRRRCTLYIEGEEYVPKAISDLFHSSSSHEIIPYRGIRFDDGTEEVVPLGVFGIDEFDAEDSGEEVSTTVKGFDRSKEVQRRRFTELYYIDKGTNYGNAIRNLVDLAMPGLTYNFTSTDHITPSMVLGEGGWSGGGNPWDKAQEMAASIGMQLFFDNRGAVRMRPEPDPAKDPVVWQYNDDEESTLLYLNKSSSRENVYNYVVVVGNNSGLFAPVRAEAFDNDPNSPTYIHTYGKVPTFHRSTLIFSEQQAQDMAEAQLLKHLGTPERVRFIGIVNPALAVGDVISINRGRLGINAKYVLDKINVPLGYTGSMNITTRERRV